MSCPSMASNYANSHLVPISFRSRSDLVLDADHSLGFFRNLSRFTGVYLIL